MNNLKVAFFMIAACLFNVGYADQLTRQNGAPVGDNQNSQTAGAAGPVLLQDVHLIEKLASLNRERVPERVVHARGTGVHGFYENLVDLSEITIAAPFAEAGKKTEVFVRFSSVVHGHQSPETLRDPRGFAVKFYTEQGNWDLVGNNFPVFFIRDAIKFPDLVHSLKPSPVTNAQDPNRFFDFFSLVPESTHMLTFLYSDLGTPRSYLNMDGYGVHAFKFVDADRNVKYVKFNWKSSQPIETFTAKEASAMQGKDFQPLTTDIYTKIGARGQTASWVLRVQVLEQNQLNDFAFNPLDATKIWPEALVPYQVVGRLVLNRVPDNYFEETEQAAFSPANMIPGIEPSEDRLFQGRLFSYADTQRYRIGANAHQLPINSPRNAEVENHTQNGQLSSATTTRDVNYQPSRSIAVDDNRQHAYSSTPISGSTQQIPFHKKQNFRQAGEFYRSFDEQGRRNLVANFSHDLGTVESQVVRETIAAFLYNADAEYGKEVAKNIDVDLERVQEVAQWLLDQQTLGR